MTNISLCIQVKNEADLLKGCLKDLYDSVEEIILVNNGSTDHTRDVGQQFGCKIIDNHEAIGDGGRNTYLNHAKEEWILVLDADERMERHSIYKIKEALKNVHENTMAFKIPNYTYTGKGRWAGLKLPRIIRNRSDIRYDQNVHASIVPAIKKIGGVIEQINAPIHHIDILIKNRTAKKREGYIQTIESIS